MRSRASLVAALLALLPACSGTESPVASDAGSNPDVGTTQPDAGGGSDAGSGGDSSFDSGNGDASPCPNGKHLCSGTCYATGDTAHCGPSCENCPVPQFGGATCDGVQCGILCTSLQCGTTCVDPSSDGKNCGSCGRDCGGASCFSGVCEGIQIGNAPVKPNNIAVDANNVYFDELAGTHVMQMALATGVTTTLSSVASDPVAVAVDPSNVYWSEAGTAINKTPIGGGAITPVVSGDPNIFSFKIDSTNAYYYGSGGLHQVPLAGGSPSLLVASTDLAAWAVDATNVYWAETTGTFVSTVYQEPRGADSAAPVVLAGNLTNGINDLAVDASKVYFIQGSRVASIPIGGGPMNVLTIVSGGSNLSVDATSLYWVDTVANQIVKIAKTGGSIKVLAAVLTPSPFLAIDGTYVYFVTQSTIIEKTPK